MYSAFKLQFGRNIHSAPPPQAKPAPQRWWLSVVVAWVAEGGAQVGQLNDARISVSPHAKPALTNSIKLGVGKIRQHVFLCAGPKCCTPEVGQEAWETLKQKIKETGLSSGENVCQRSRAGCLRVCCHGPTVVVYPEQVWYGGVRVEDVPEIIERHLVGGVPVERLRMK